MSRKSTSRATLRGIKAVAFDAYGTLFNFTEPDFIATMAEICADQGLEADAADLWKRFLKASDVMRSEHHEDPVYKRYDQAWADQFEMVFADLGLAGDAWKASRLFKQQLAEADAFDDVQPVLGALREHYAVALLSNADDDFLHEVLERNGLHFETIITSEAAGAIKPNAAIFNYLADRLGMDNGQVLYAGDNPIPDVLGPKRAGMAAAWVNREGYRKPRNIPFPDLRVKSLTELVPYLVPAVG
jgi:2-haloalkanoic acid dehalogenase type II